VIPADVDVLPAGADARSRKLADRPLLQPAESGSLADGPLLSSSGDDEGTGRAAALCESGSIPAQRAPSDWIQSSSPALTCIIGARRLRIVPMISSTSIPCR
jgi:hypothetical protein